MSRARLVLSASAFGDLVVGLALLFAPSETTGVLGLGGASNPAWPLQVLAAALLGFASLNWLSRTSLAGGIYARPLVSANVTFHFVSALVLLRVGLVVSWPSPLWVLFAVDALFAALFIGLLVTSPTKT